MRAIIGQELRIPEQQNKYNNNVSPQDLSIGALDLLIPISLILSIGMCAVLLLFSSLIFVVTSYLSTTGAKSVRAQYENNIILNYKISFLVN